MNLTLRLLVTTAWPAEAACEWALVNGQGMVLQRGKSEPRHWPAADGCEVVLSAEQSLLVHTQLPKGARARPAEVIAYALEDQLIGEAEAEHIVLGTDHGPAGQATPVWVIAAARMKALLAALGALERTPQRIISELQLAPLGSGNWSVCLPGERSGGFVRQGPEQGFAFDLADPRQPPLELKLALEAAPTRPVGLDVYGARAKADPFDAAAWQASLGVPVRLAGEYAWRDTPGLDARNLMSGEFAPPRAAGTGWDSFKPALLLGATALVLYGLFSFGEWIWLERQSSQLRQQMADSFRAAYPQAQSIVDPPLQMQRLTDQMRRARGQLGSTDFLPLLAAASEALGAAGRLQSLGYEDGRLELGVLLADNAAVERTQQALVSRGLATTLRDAHAAGGGIEATFALRGLP